MLDVLDFLRIVKFIFVEIYFCHENDHIHIVDPNIDRSVLSTLQSLGKEQNRDVVNI